MRGFEYDLDNSILNFITSIVCPKNIFFQMYLNEPKELVKNFY